MEISEPTSLCSNCLELIPESKFCLHEVHCARYMIRCLKCKNMIDKREVDEHNEEMHKKANCSFCKKQIDISEKAMHENNCIKKPITCEYCNTQILPIDYDEHVYLCGSKTTICEVCNKTIIKKNLLYHQYECKSEPDNYIEKFPTLQETYGKPANENKAPSKRKVKIFEVDNDNEIPSTKDNKTEQRKIDETNNNSNLSTNNNYNPNLKSKILNNDYDKNIQIKNLEQKILRSQPLYDSYQSINSLNNEEENSKFMYDKNDMYTNSGHSHNHTYKSDLTTKYLKEQGEKYNYSQENRKDNNMNYDNKYNDKTNKDKSYIETTYSLLKDKKGYNSYTNQQIKPSGIDYNSFEGSYSKGTYKQSNFDYKNTFNSSDSNLNEQQQALSSSYFTGKDNNLSRLPTGEKKFNAQDEDIDKDSKSSELIAKLIQMEEDAKYAQKIQENSENEEEILEGYGNDPYRSNYPNPYRNITNYNKNIDESNLEHPHHDFDPTRIYNREQMIEKNTYHQEYPKNTRRNFKIIDSSEDIDLKKAIEESLKNK